MSPLGLGRGEIVLDSMQFTVGEWFLLAQHELMLFAAVFFAFGVIDELLVDLVYIWTRLTGQAKDIVIDERELASKDLAGPACVFIPAWQEAEIIGPTIAHLLAAWPHRKLTLYVGCYQNDQATQAAVRHAGGCDDRVRLVVNGADGPKSKADCLNRIYRALCEDEAASGKRARMIVLQDAEDMVDPAGLNVMDEALDKAAFVQLPVLALPQSGSRWIGTHYSDEFAEAHAKTMVVRSWLGAAVPGAGVGSAISRDALAKFGAAPFEEQSLTEDYELGLRIAGAGMRTRFLRCRTSNGRLIATRAYFPCKWKAAVRQKTRWMHGIALQSWDRLGWAGGWVNLWMQLRDRRGPLAAILMTCAYALVISTIFSVLLSGMGLAKPMPLSPLLIFLLGFNMAGFAWRLLARSWFTGREYGFSQGLAAIPRAVVSNFIAIFAAHRALGAYIRALRGSPLVWDKTDHRDHPTFAIEKSSS